MATKRRKTSKRKAAAPAASTATAPTTEPSAAPAPRSPRLTCRFYRTTAGNEPVRDWLKSLPPSVRKEVGSDILVAQWRWPVGKPLVDGFGAGLFEVRTSHDGNIYRTLFCIEGSTMVLLHGFMKKTKKTHAQDIDTARKRQRNEEEP